MRGISEAVRLEEAAKLKALWDKLSKESQRDFGSRHGIGSANMVWQYLKGHRPLNVMVAARFAAGLQVSILSFSPRLAIEAAFVADQLKPARLTLTPHGQVGEQPPKPYIWPFRSITPEQFNRLKAELQAKVEAFASGVIAAADDHE